MNNLYYYTFYLLYKFSRRIKKDDKSPAFTAVMLISTPMFLNLLSVIIFFGGFSYHEAKAKITLLCTFIVVPFVGLNYYFLMGNKKNEEIIAFFDEKYKYKKHNVGLTLLVVAYFIVSSVVCIYLAKHQRDMMQQSHAF